VLSDHFPDVLIGKLASGRGIHLKVLVVLVSRKEQPLRFGEIKS